MDCRFSLENNKDHPFLVISMSFVLSYIPTHWAVYIYDQLHTVNASEYGIYEYVLKEWHIWYIQYNKTETCRVHHSHKAFVCTLCGTLQPKTHDSQADMRMNCHIHSTVMIIMAMSIQPCAEHMYLWTHGSAASQAPRMGCFQSFHSWWIICRNYNFCMCIFKAKSWNQCANTVLHCGKCFLAKCNGNHMPCVHVLVDWK